jgi:hypothetical protein
VSADAAVTAAIRRLEQLVEEMPPALSEPEAQALAAGMRWSRKEILGHLIDSAGNNHQRFVRAQYQERMSFPRYVQDQWIAAQGYGERPWSELVELWRLYNRLRKGSLPEVSRRVPRRVELLVILHLFCTSDEDGLSHGRAASGSSYK